MPKTLVVVESPAKARTINRYLGKDYKVVASMGHIRDLPKTKLGVDVEAGFSPAYEPIPARKKVIKELKDAAKGASRIYVATDPDREGEAIGWHLAREVGRKKTVGRLMFNEITKSAVSAALERVGEIDQRMVDAQQARRVLDRLVGYKLSPLLWDKVQRGLSAGRVQSVALKLVCDREDAIDAFEVEEYWHVTARLAAGVPPEFDARLARKGKQAVKLRNEADAKAAVADLEKADFVVDSVATKERKRHPSPPFITSKLQQASRFPVRRTMQIAQQLYEGIELPGEGSVGLITYMRTDSTRVADQAIAAARDHIAEAYGREFLPARPKQYRAGKDAQDAHEAIRPTSMAIDPAAVRPHLTKEQHYLYQLIWNRFVASQMQPATFDDTSVEVRAGDYLLRAKGSVPKVSGWLPRLREGAAARRRSGRVRRGRCRRGGRGRRGRRGRRRSRDRPAAADGGERPPRAQGAPAGAEVHAAAAAVRRGDAGQGARGERHRPAEHLRVDHRDAADARVRGEDREPVQADAAGPAGHPTADAQLRRHHPGRLHAGSGGPPGPHRGRARRLPRHAVELLREVQHRPREAVTAMPNVKAEGLPSDETCDKCGSKMIVKIGRFGMFLACSAYPECQNTREMEQADSAAAEEQQEETCDACGRPMVVKRGRFGQFLACSAIPSARRRAS